MNRRLEPRSEELVTGEIRIQIRYEKFDVSPFRRTLSEEY